MRAVTAPPSEASSTAQALATVLEVLRSLTDGSEQISPKTPLFKVGIDSASAAQFVGVLRQQTGLQLSPTLIFEHSTAEDIALHLSGGVDACVPLAAPAGW